MYYTKGVVPMTNRCFVDNTVIFTRQSRNPSKRFIQDFYGGYYIFVKVFFVKGIISFGRKYTYAGKLHIYVKQAFYGLFREK